MSESKHVGKDITDRMVVIEEEKNRISNLTRFNDEIIDYWQNLEDQVEKRTVELKASNERYSALLNAVPDLMFRINKNGFFLDFKDSEEGFLIPKEKIIGSNICDLPMPENVIHDIFGCIKKTLKTGNIQLYEYEIKLSDKIIYYESRFVKSGEDEVVTLIRDITESKNNEKLRRLSENNLQKEKEFIQKILDTSPVFFVAFDNKGKVLKMNASMLNALGYTEEEVVGKDYIINFVPEENRELIKTIIQKLKNTSENSFNENWILTREGKKLLVEWYGRQVFKNDDSSDFFIGLGIDITFKRQTEEALRESEERFRSLTELLPQSIYEVDLGGKVLYANLAALDTFKYTQEDLKKGLYVFDTISPEERKKAKSNLERLIETGIVKGMEYNCLRKDGTKFPVVIYSNLIYKKDIPIGIRGIVIDLTEKKIAEEKEKKYMQQLMQADKMISLGTLVSGVAHEINNPNNCIMFNTPILKELFNGMLTILEEQFSGKQGISIGGNDWAEIKESAPKLFEAISRSSDRIKNIVDDFKNFARPNPTEDFHRVYINEIVKASVALLNNMIRKSTGRFYVEYGESLPWVLGNFQRLEQVIINLIQNACQAIQDKNKSIRIATCEEETENGSSVCIIVEDEGCGIDEKEMKYIFDPFFTTRRHLGGTGLGLSISHRIIKDHGGSIEYKSKLGVGSTFIVKLPININGKRLNSDKNNLDSRETK